MSFVTISEWGQVPPHEVQALEALYNACGGEFWTWRSEEEIYGAKWNFTVDELTGELLNNPCSSSNSSWQGVTCSLPPSQCSNQTCSVTELNLELYNLTGTIPPGLGNLSNLNILRLLTNQLTGTIPLELGNLNNLNYLGLDSNQLIGTIPPELGNLSSLIYLGLDNNQLIGTIPSVLGNLYQLIYFGLIINQLTGTIPSELGNLTDLAVFTLDNNLLTGTIPPELGNLNILYFFSVDSNLLTGTIPLELGNLNDVYWFDLDGNHLTGTIPPMLGNLTNLQWFDLDGNQLTGIIPPELGKLTKLFWFDLDGNQLTGIIPPELGKLTKLYSLELSGNQLTGTIFSGLGMLIQLRTLDLSKNVLSGSLLPELYSLQNIGRLSLFGNRFTGSIPSTLSALTALEVFDLGDNLFTGSVPLELEQLTGMKSFILSVNCLDSLIPESVCGMSSVEVLSLNGLGSADDCSNRHHVLPFLSTLVYSTNREGTIPDCVWSLPNLTLFHMAGNGLVGHIRDPQSTFNTLISDFIASHNKLDGVVPFISSSLQYLDVSYNRLTGELTDDNSVNASLQDSSMIAKVNHLSGRVPVGSHDVSDLNVLRGNMMSCESVPSNDVDSEGYSCGSSQYDSALYFVGSSVCFAMAIALLLLSTRINIKPIDFKRSKYHQKEEAVVMLWSRDLNQYRNFFLVLLTVVLIVFLPLLVIRILDNDHIYSTHWHIYSWIVSYSFASGTKMGYLIVAMWGVALLAAWCYVFLIIEVGKSGNSNEDSPTHMTSQRADGEMRHRSWVVMSLSFFANFVLIVGVNALYVLSVTEASLSQSITLLVQLCMSLFRIVSSITLVPWLARQVPDSGRRVFFRVGLLLFNNLVVPCLAISLTSSNCFQELMVPPDSIESIYSYTICSFLFSGQEEPLVCLSAMTIHQDTAPFTPSFVYNYQCMSTLLAAYIPVLLVGFSIQLLLTAVAVVAVELQVFRFEDVPGMLRPALHGVFWPQHWISRALESGVCPVQRPSQLVAVESIVCIDMLNPLALLLTFGLSSPPLAVLIALVVASRMRMWQWAVFRFVRAVRGAAGLEGSGRSDELLGKLSKACSPTAAALCWSFPLLAVLSMLFSVFVMWDTAAEVSWEAPLLALLLVLFTSGTLHHKARLHEFISRSGLHLATRWKWEGAKEIAELRSTENPMQEESVEL